MDAAWKIEREPAGTWCLSMLQDDGSYRPMLGGLTHQRYAAEAWGAVVAGIYAASTGAAATSAAQATAVADLVTVLRGKAS